MTTVYANTGNNHHIGTYPLSDMHPQSRPARAPAIPTKGDSTGDDTSIVQDCRKLSNGTVAVRRYRKESLLGKGGFAKVYRFTNLEKNRVHAGKVVEKSSLKKEKAKQKLLAEIRIHRSLDHQNVVRFDTFFEDSQNVYIMLEVCSNKTMMELVRRRTRLSEYETQFYSLQLLDAMRYLHAHNIIHRDLKLGNLFLDSKLHIKVGDFGLAAALDHANERKKTICGTPNYIAPEVLSGDRSGHSFEVDTWSFGVILYTMLVGRPPFQTPNVKSTYERIRANHYTFPSKVTISDRAKDLIRSLLHPVPEQRPSLEQVCMHPFFTAADVRIPLALPESALSSQPSLSSLQVLSGHEFVSQMLATPVGGLRVAIKKKSAQATQSKFEGSENIQPMTNKYSTTSRAVPAGDAVSAARRVFQELDLNGAAPGTKQTQQNQGLSSRAVQRNEPSRRYVRSNTVSSNTNGNIASCSTACTTSVRTTSTNEHDKENIPVQIYGKQTHSTSSTNGYRPHLRPLSVKHEEDTNTMPVPPAMLNVGTARVAQVVPPSIPENSERCASINSLLTPSSSLGTPMTTVGSLDSQAKHSSPVPAQGFGFGVASNSETHAKQAESTQASQDTPVISMTSNTQSASSKHVTNENQATHTYRTTTTSHRQLEMHTGVSTPQSSDENRPRTRKEIDTLKKMHGRLTQSFSQDESVITHGTHDGQSDTHDMNDRPNIWVCTWVDYTSKYGVGYLLSNNCVGVYFNDATKIILASDGEHFEYIERSTAVAHAGPDGKREIMRQCYTLSNYPEELKKKVTLLRHFKGYLMDQQAARTNVAEEEQNALDKGSELFDLPFVKKCVHTRHAFLFRLSNRTVQVNFLDKTCIVLSSEASLITFVDKHGTRTYHALANILNSGRPDIAKRLRYIKDILHQLITGVRK